MENRIIHPENIYVLNKNEGVLAVFSKDDDDTLIDPEITEIQNKEAELAFQVPASSKKWNDTYDPENLYLVDGKIFSANFEDSVKVLYDVDDTELITVRAYERQKLLERKFAKIYNSTTGYEELDDEGKPVEGGKIYIDELMIIILSGGNKPLINGAHIVPTNFEKGTSGYALDALLYGTGWRTGICDVEGKFDIETDQVNIWNNILQIQETWGGILVVDSLNKIIHHRDETKYLPYSGYEIKEEKNLQTYEYIGKNKIITHLAVFGEGNLNIKAINDDSIWLTNYSYTDSVYEDTINNDNIFDQEQLKRWGERKLLELCKPRKELSVTFPLLHRVPGFEHEKIGLNHIVDVTNYDLKEDKSSQLRVLEYTHKVWSDEDANVVVGDITLESTDIFKKQVQATNLIVNGILDTSKIIDYYKNGQSLRETLREIDKTIVQTKSEFSKSDDEIRAAVEQIETDVDTLNNDIVSQNRTLAELSVSVGEINSKVETIADLTEIITGHNGRVVLDEAVNGYLLGLSVHGYDGSFRATYLSDDTVIDDDLTLLDTSISVNVYTKNKCPTSKEYYEQGYYDKNTLENLNYRLESTNLKGYISIFARYDTENMHYTDGKWNYHGEIVPTEYDNTFYYLNIKPNTRYLVDLNIDELKGGKYWALGTYTKDWIEKVNEENWEKFPLNNSVCNAYYDDENTQWIYDEKITQFEIQTGEQDEQLILYIVAGYNLNELTNNMKIYEITEQNYLKTINPFYVEPNSEMYFSLDNSNYRFVNAYFYNEYKEYLTDWNTLHSDDTISGLTEKFITIPENAYFMSYVITKSIQEIPSTFNVTSRSESPVNPSGSNGTGGIIGPEQPGDEEIPEDEEQQKVFILTPDLLSVIKPQLEYGSMKTDFIEYNTQNWEFTLDDELRIAENDEGVEVYDEFTIIDKNAQLIKRIGVDDEGNNYILTNPEYISYGTIEIPIVQGQNIVEVVHYTPTIIAEYVKQNKYTDLFATNVQVSTLIKQTDDLILLAANKMVSKDGLIQEFNSQIAISPEKILIEGDRISIRSSYFTLTDEGEITATKGSIAGWVIDEHQIYKDIDGYRTALYDGSSGPGYDETSFYAGLPVDDTNIHHAGFRIRRNGAVNMRYAHILDEEGGLKIWYDRSEREDGQSQECMIFTKCGFWNYLANGNYWSYLGVSFDSSGTDYGYGMFLNDAKAFEVISDLHRQTLFQVKRVGNDNSEGGVYAWKPFYVNGYEVKGTSSDKRLKINIFDAVTKGLDVIKSIAHKSFDWIENGLHISIGYIAQELIKIDPNFVIYNSEFDTYQINLLYILASATKAIQEEDEKVEELKKENEKLKKIVKMLADKSGLSGEIEDILNN